MAPEQIEKIFLPFEQVGDTRSRAEGTGLGLAVTRRLVELMGSNVQVKSEPGKGSTFWFEIEFPSVVVEKTDEHSRDRKITGYKGQRRKVLITEDDRSNRSMLVDLLTPLGFKVVLAESGQEEVDKARATRPDIILTDLVMPGMNGIEAVQHIRQIPDLKEVVIIAISANVFEKDRQQTILAGCDAFIAKPIDTGQLLDVLATQLNLKWIYEETEREEPVEAIAGVQEPLVPLPPEEIEILHDLIMGGDMDEIQEYATHLERLGASYIPFANRLKELAKGFQEEEIWSFVEQYREAKP
jgi:CheY-like chemotaxis protein